MKKNREYMLARIDDELYISNGVRVFEVNNLGAEIYNLINGKNKLEDIYEVISAKYQTPIEDIKKDVTEAIADYKKFKIIE